MNLRAPLTCLLLALVAPAAWSGICALDDAPAATLLLPYFEVDPGRPAGRTTLFSVNNAGPEAVAAKVTFWTDLGVPTFSFSLYLTGYDVETINLRDVFDGKFPRTSSPVGDPGDTISPKGPYSGDIDISGCGFAVPPPTIFLAEQMRNAHTGRPVASFGDRCAGQFLGDGVVRGYATVDAVRRCDFLFPSDPGYFGPNGTATNQNVLWGDFILVDQENNFAQGENLVRIEADPSAFKSGDSTFYGRYVGYSAADAREPLASVWASRFVTGGAFSGGTDLLVWRDSGQANGYFPCTAVKPYPWYPLDVDDFALFDEQETGDRVVLPPFPVPVPIPPLLPAFPGEANRVKLDSSALPVPFDFGWIVADFGRQAPGKRGAQAWVETLMSASGRFSVGYKANPLVDICHAQNPQFGQPGR